MTTWTNNRVIKNTCNYNHWLVDTLLMAGMIGYPNSDESSCERVTFILTAGLFHECHTPNKDTEANDGINCE